MLEEMGFGACGREATRAQGSRWVALGNPAEGSSGDSFEGRGREGQPSAACCYLPESQGSLERAVEFLTT